MAVSSDVFLQILKVSKRKSSLDISLIGILIRFIAVNIFLTKFILEGDPYLISGQIFFNTLLFVYLLTIAWYRKSGEKNDKKSILK
jgi:uncharacterized protein with PQ loop repeat